MSTWAGIVRVSHIGSRNGDSFHADEEQVADVKRYAAQHGAHVEFMAPELSVSGGKSIDERPPLRAAIEGVERGDFTGIVVAYLSRLTRSRSGIQIWERVEAAGGHVHCAAENLDTSTPSGRFVRDIHLANAVREREEHADRHAKRRRKTVEAGVWRQRQVPRGLAFAGPAVDGRYRGKARRLVHGPDADAVRQTFRDRKRGASISMLAARLGMTPGGVRAMLRNRIYLGELRDGETVNLHALKPLVDVETFDAVQAGLPRPARSVSDGPALLAGLIRCAGCGHVMSRKRAKSVVYACAGLHSGERCGQPASVTAALIDAHVERIALAELQRLAVTASEGRGVEHAQAAVAGAETELAALVKAVTAAGLEAGDVVGELRERKAAVQAARDALRAEQARSPHLPASGSGADVWADLNAHERNQLLRSLLTAVVVARAGGRGARVPLPDRVRVLRFGADVRLPVRRGGEASGIVPIALEDLHGPDVLGVTGSEDRL